MAKRNQWMLTQPALFDVPAVERYTDLAVGLKTRNCLFFNGRFINRHNQLTGLLSPPFELSSFLKNLRFFPRRQGFYVDLDGQSIDNTTPVAPPSGPSTMGLLKDRKVVVLGPNHLRTLTTSLNIATWFSGLATFFRFFWVLATQMRGRSTQHPPVGVFKLVVFK